MATNTNSGNYNKSLSVRNVFKGLEDSLKVKVKNALENSRIYIQDKLGTSFKNGGCSAYDEYRYTYSKKRRSAIHSYNKWSIRDRGSKNSYSLEIRNRSSYAKLLYTDKASTGHASGFRSSNPHSPVIYKKRGTLVVLTREDQISKTKWLRCVNMFENHIKNSILKGKMQ